MNCLDNLSKCHSACCRFICLPIAQQDYRHHEEYWKLHGIVLLRPGLVLVPCKCSALRDDGKCNLHGGKKPEICENGYSGEEPDLIWFNECAFLDRKPPNDILVKTGDPEHGH